MRRTALLLAAALAAGCGKDGGQREQAAALPEQVTLFAAASLQPAMEGIVRLHAQRTGKEVREVYAASSVLAKQVEAGASADAVILADPAWTDYLDRKGLLDPDAHFDLVGNSLVLVSPVAEPFAFDPAARVPLADAFEGRIALGDPDHVPLGRYARQALQRAGWWSALESRVLAGSDARSTLLLVERRECRAGIVYASDAVASRHARVVAAIPEEWHDPIVYPVAIPRGRDRPAVRAFLETLRTPEAADLLWESGFRPPPPSEGS